MRARPFLSDVSLKPSARPLMDTFPFSLPVVRALGHLPMHPQVTFFVGENGSGKSTLLEAIAVAMGLNAEGGGRNFSFTTRASHSGLHDHLRLVRGITPPRDSYFLRAESFFNVSTEIERLDREGFGPRIIDSYGGKPLHEQSHGEAFLTLFMERFGGKGFYVLDEPEAALSPQRQLAMLSRLHDLARSGSQFVVATHSPILMAYPDAVIYECGAGGIRQVAYEDTEHYRVMHDFIANPQRMLKVLPAD